MSTNARRRKAAREADRVPGAKPPANYLGPNREQRRNSGRAVTLTRRDAVSRRMQFEAALAAALGGKRT